MSAPLTRLVIYTKRVEEMIAFYCTHFGYSSFQEEGDRIVELTPPAGGTILMLYPMGAGRKEGQTLVKLLFDVKDVEGFCDEKRASGLEFGPIHNANGYEFANAKDPSGNSISISSRAFRGEQ